MKTSVKITCKCTGGQAAEFQDTTYGKGTRIATVSQKGDSKASTREVSCTVCGAKQTKNVE